MRAQLDEANKSLDTARADQDSINEQLAEIDSMAKEREALLAKIAELEELGASVHQWREQAAKMGEELENASTVQSEMVQRLRRLSRLEDAAAERDELAAGIAKLQGTIGELQKEAIKARDAEDRLADMQAREDAQTNEIMVLDRSKKELMETVERLNQQLLAVGEMETELKRLREESKALREAQAGAEELAATVGKLESQLETARMETNEVRDDVSRYGNLKSISMPSDRVIGHCCTDEVVADCGSTYSSHTMI